MVLPALTHFVVVVIVVFVYFVSWRFSDHTNSVN